MICPRCSRDNPAEATLAAARQLAAAGRADGTEVQAARAGAFWRSVRGSHFIRELGRLRTHP